MSDQPSLPANGFNVKVTPPVPNAPVGTNPLSKGQKMADPTDPSLKREVPKLYEYNVETGEQDLVLSSEEKAKLSQEKVSTKAKESEADSKKRHQEWKAKQQEKKDAREAAKNDKAAKSQALALDFLRKGDMGGAAKALNVTIAELVTLTQNASLSIPTEEKKLSAEEQKAKDEADYRASLENRLKASEERDYQNTKYKFITQEIEPVFNNKEKYELLNNHDDISVIKSEVYEFMNQHFVETFNTTGKGEVLSVEDILDTMEDHLSKVAEGSVQKLKGLKKFSKYFTQAEKDEAEAEEAKEKVQSKPKAKFAPQVEEDDLEIDEDEEENDQPKFNVSRNIPGLPAGKKSVGVMSHRERVDFFRNQR